MKYSNLMRKSQLKEPDLNSVHTDWSILCNIRVSQFELNYWNKWTFPRYSNLLRCTCMWFTSVQIFWTSLIFLSRIISLLFSCSEVGNHHWDAPIHLHHIYSFSNCCRKKSSTNEYLWQKWQTLDLILLEVLHVAAEQLVLRRTETKR